MTRWGGRRCEWIVLTGLMVALVVCNMLLTLPTKCPAIDPMAALGEISCESCQSTTTNGIEVDPLAKLNLRLGRWDASRTYRSFDYAAVGSLYPGISSSRLVCLATQSSIETVTEILKITAHWSGPVSAAVYVVAEEMILLRSFVKWLLDCQPDTYSRLAIHIVTPYENPAVIGDSPYWTQNCSEIPNLSGQRSEETIAWRARNKYPQNVLRNLARKNCQTPYVYLVDIDIVPCLNMAESLERFLGASDCSKCAFVIPTYELDWNVTHFPKSKSELLKLVKMKKAVAYHSKVFKANQQSSDLAKWESRNGKEGSVTYVSHNVTAFKLLYEPFYVARDTVPPHEERFVGYGFTRNSQVYEMYLQGYQFKVLSPIFTIHWGLQSRKRPKWRMKQIWKNYHKFKTFQKELYARYGKDPLNLFADKNKKKQETNKT